MEGIGGVRMTRVLVVDDDHLVRKGFISLMPWREYGFEIVGEAGNGKQALQFLGEQEADLVITDLLMPKMSGLELMKQLNQSYPRLPVVVLTFYQDFEYIQEALRLGAIDYITKEELVTEQMHEVLKRISGRLQNRFLYVDHREVRKLRESWLGEQWLHDDALFESLMNEMREWNIPQELLREWFEEAIEHWQRRFGLTAPELGRMPATGDWPQYASWLADVRAAVRDSQQESRYSEEVVNCIQQALAYIKHELPNDLNLVKSARQVNMSRSYFSRCFKDIVGMTFHEYVRAERMELAKSLLLKTNRQIGWIAVQAGYPNDKYFSKVFRESTGLLPSEFRKQAQSFTE